MASFSRMIVIVIVVAIGIVLLAALTPLPANPFQRQRLDGDLISWDTVERRGWVTSGDRHIALHLVGTAIGQAPAPGCRIRAEGSYEATPAQATLVLAADLLIVSDCPPAAGSRPGAAR